MGVMYWVRVVIMIFAFVGVLTVMRQLNSAAKTGSSAPLVEIFTGRPQSDNAIDLCPTRITELQLLGGPFFYQSGMKWVMRQNGQVAELDQIAMEKWFSRNCVLETTPIDDVKDPQPIVKVSFVAGVPQTLMSSPDGFIWMGRKFKSEQLQLALAELTKIPTRPVSN
jgi:hypothetical protein